jgi:hypothetical protein
MRKRTGEEIRVVRRLVMYTRITEQDEVNKCEAETAIKRYELRNAKVAQL